jgi:hypothetical protein
MYYLVVFKIAARQGRASDIGLESGKTSRASPALEHSHALVLFNGEQAAVLALALLNSAIAAIYTSHDSLALRNTSVDARSASPKGTRPTSGSAAMLIGASSSRLSSSSLRSSSFLSFSTLYSLCATRGEAARGHGQQRRTHEPVLHAGLARAAAAPEDEGTIGQECGGVYGERVEAMSSVLSSHLCVMWTGETRDCAVWRAYLRARPWLGPSAPGVSPVVIHRNAPG